MWLVSRGQLGADVKILCTSLDDMFHYLNDFKEQLVSIQFIRVYTKPEKAESKEDYKPLVPLSRQK